VTRGLFSYLALCLAVAICARFDEHPVAVLALLSIVVAAIVLHDGKVKL
jgi:hypothetical protein